MQPEHLAHLEEVAKPSLVDPEPFEWTPQEPSDYQYELVDGIMRVYHGDDRSEEAFPLPGNSYDFFSDMHWWGALRNLDDAVVLEQRSMHGSPEITGSQVLCPAISQK